MSEVFLKAVIRGTRFTKKSIPVDFLPELATYRSFVVAVAKHLFLKENRGRQRVPRGFADGFELALAEINEGSAIATLVRKPRCGLFHDEFDKAQDLIACCIDGAANDDAVLEEFPADLLYFFDRFGRRLKDNDSIELQIPQRQPVVYNQAVRKRLILRQDQHYTKPVLVIVRIEMADVTNRRFRARLLDGTNTTASLDEHCEPLILKALEDYQNKLVRLDGTGEFDAADSLRRITELNEVVLVDEDLADAIEGVAERLSALSSLKDNWLDGQGRAPCPFALGWCRRQLPDLIFRCGLPQPRLYPTPSGGLQIEWATDRADVTLAVDGVQRTVTFELVRFDEEEEEESVDFEIPFDSEDDLRNRMVEVGSLIGAKVDE